MIILGAQDPESKSTPACHCVREYAIPWNMELLVMESIWLVAGARLIAYGWTYKDKQPVRSKRICTPGER